MFRKASKSGRAEVDPSINWYKVEIFLWISVIPVAKKLDDSTQKDGDINVLVWPATYDDLVGIHVGDDLVYDVGGSAQCGAKTVLVEQK